MTDTVRTLSDLLALLHPNILNGMPDATVLQSQTARDLLVSLGNLAGGNFVVDGGYYPLTRAGIVLAQTDASNAGGGTVILKKPGGGTVTLDSTSIARRNNVGIQTAPGTSLLAPQGVIAGAAFSNSVTKTAGSSLNATCLAGTLTTTLTAGGVVANGIVAGSIVEMSDNPVLPVRYQLNQVYSVSGDVITWQDELAFDFFNTDEAYRIVSPLTNSPLSVEIDCTGNTGAYFGISEAGSYQCDITKCKFTNFTQRPSLQVSFSYGSKYEDIQETGGGNGFAFGALDWEGVWGASWRRIKTNSTGFSILLGYCGGGLAYDIDGRTLNGRGIKNDYCGNLDLLECQGLDHGNTFTGIMTSGVYRNIKLIACKAIGCGNVGFGTGTNGGNGLALINCTAENCATQDILIGASDNDTRVINPISRTNLFAFTGGSYEVKGWKTRVSTTNATVTVVCTITAGSMAGATKVYARVAGFRTGGSSGIALDSAGYERSATFKGDGAGVCTQVGATAALETSEDQAAWDCQIAASGGTAIVAITGAANNNINWECSVDILARAA